MKRKLVSLLLAMTMVISMVGCGSKKEGSDDKTATGGTVQETVADVSTTDSDPSKWQVVSVECAAFGELTGEATVEKALNDYLVSINSGVQVDMVAINFGDLNTQLTLMLSDNDKPLDLFCWRFYSNLDGCVKNEQCISLEAYKDQYPDVWKMFTDKIMMTQQIDGTQYAIPAVDSFATYETYILRKDIAEEIGVADKDGQKITMDELTEIMLKAQQAHPEFKYMINTEDEPVQAIDSLGNGDWLGVLMNRGVDQTKIVNYYETPEFKEYCERINGWEEDGLLLDDPLNAELNISQYNNGVAAGCYVGGYSAEYIKALLATSSYESVQFQLTDLVGTSASVLGGWCVSSVCKNPDAAIKVLSLMLTDEKVARFFILGVEGENYVVDENGCAWYPEGVDANSSTWNLSAPWFYPNQCLSLPFNTTMTTYYTDMLEAPNNAKFSSAMGFIFDSASVYDQVASCSAVVDQYRKALMYGQVDIDEYLDKFNKELKSAGLDDIIAEEQKQLDEFFASNN